MSIGGTQGEDGQQSVDISKYLLNFNSSDWATQANTYLQNALAQGLPYSEKYSQLASDVIQTSTKQSEQQQREGFQTAQALQAPQRLATYQALDAYQDLLGLSRPTMGSAQYAQQGPLNQPQWVNRNPSLFQGGV